MRFPPPPDAATVRLNALLVEWLVLSFTLIVKLYVPRLCVLPITPAAVSVRPDGSALPDASDQV